MSAAVMALVCVVDIATQPYCHCRRGVWNSGLCNKLKMSCISCSLTASRLDLGDSAKIGWYVSRAICAFEAWVSLEFVCSWCGDLETRDDAERGLNRREEVRNQ